MRNFRLLTSGFIFRQTDLASGLWSKRRAMLQMSYFQTWGDLLAVQGEAVNGLLDSPYACADGNL